MTGSLLADPLRLTIAGRMAALHVVELGLACCAVEVAAAREALRPGRYPVIGIDGGLDVAPWDRDHGPREPSRDQLGPSPGGDLTVLLVAGTVTVAAAPRLRELLAARTTDSHLAQIKEGSVRTTPARPSATRVVAFGACAISGGPYWDSYAVVPGAAVLGEVDLVIPGCPPRPEALWSGLGHLLLAEAA